MDNGKNCAMPKRWYRLNVTNLDEMRHAMELMAEWGTECPYTTSGVSADAAGERVDGKSADDADERYLRLYRKLTPPTSAMAALRLIYKKYMLAVFVSCTYDELLAMHMRLTANGVRCSLHKENAGHGVKVYDAHELNALCWLLESAPTFTLEKTVPDRTVRATARIAGGPWLTGRLKKLNKTKETDRFWLDCFGEVIVSFLIPKGSAQPLKMDDEQRFAVRAYEGTRWMVMHHLSSREIKMMVALKKWVAYKLEKQGKAMKLNVFLPMEDRKASASGEKRSKNWNREGVLWLTMHKRMLVSGYVFIEADYAFLHELEIENDLIMGIRPIWHLLCRDGMPVYIPNPVMHSFISAVGENIVQLDLTDDDFVEGDYAMLIDEEKFPLLKGFVGKVVRKNKKLFLTFNPLPGLLSTIKAVRVTSGQIRKLTAKEKAQWEM